MLQPGDRIADRYEIVKLIGEGGMGFVFEAKHVALGKRVALKLLNKDFSQNQEALERFQQEAKIAGSIGHLNICEVMDFGLTGEGLPYLVMDFLEGESLAEILKREKKIPEDIALGILSQILSALEEVHGKGIMHRDLKPENVFVTNVKGHGLVVKLLDFGISKVMKAGPESMRLTKTGSMVGTPYYMSPEQVRGNKDIDLRTDIYACGVMLYEMVTGKVPYGGSSYNEVIIGIIEKDYPDPRRITPDLPEQVVDLIRSSMQKNPTKRTPTVSAFKEQVTALQQLQQADDEVSRSVKFSSTRLDSMVDVPALTERRSTHIRIASIVGAIVAVMVITLGIMLFIFSGTKRNQVSEDTKTKGGKIEIPVTTRPPETVTAAKEPEAKKVRIELTNAPDNVRIMHAGREIEGNVLEVEKSKEPISFTIKAEGYEQRQLKIIPSDDMKIEGMLPATAEKKPEKEKKPAAATTKKPPTVQKKPPKVKKGKKKKKKEELNHVWSYPG